MSNPEICAVVRQQWTLKGIVFVTKVSPAWQQLAHNSYVSSQSDEGTVTPWNVQNCCSTTVHHTTEDLHLQNYGCENLTTAYII
jgi:hypothetical protein